ncbi:co-chaperone DjlA [Oleiagrimonas sp. MCCC 1A03011]|uniref:co-chaperone DjlA n=1 Tax=Oleiagrimonas sp. MCCC 1A03011 TaxID=1926883 RepID=UPI000DC39680|nr:co-chaperone DjlA [Oleiagrimonas sp. MCCC 1A03011]RAP59695.1 molecular chaperone DjlA [Oleiagrimonas sp. MCCC 1A03011]
MGAIIGAVIGYLLLHNVAGAIIGGVVGWLLTSSQRAARPRTSFDQVLQPLFALLGAVAKADGRVSEKEIAVAERLMARMGLTREQRRHAVASFNLGKQSDFDLDAALAQLRQWTGGRRDHAITILDVVVETVLAEGASEGKMQLLRRLAAALRISEMELMAVMAMKGYAWTPPGGGGRGWGGAHGGGYTPPRREPSGPDPYAILGVQRDADDRAIKRAYRKLISEHHPDRLGDLPEDLRKRAEERASEINAAYERIKAERGFK